jgi:hypothetical protein
MNWAELITVRSTGNSKKALTLALHELMNDIVTKYGPERIQMYHRQTIDTDFCIILSHEGETIGDRGSHLGMRVTAALKVFGMVNHSVWSEMK